ncbi:MAG TPA: CsgG/HfaB family protein [Gemmatimonadaceae bacterium]|nr:CsgG/HfaB family protein [Gemmatimonadaceae bacterium]
MFRYAFATLTALSALAGVATAQAPDSRPTVAVMNFDNGAMGKQQHEDFDAFTSGISQMLVTELAADQQIRVVEREQLQHLMEEQNIDPKRVDPSTAVRLGKLLGAHHMIFGGFVSDPSGRMILTSRSVNVETSQVEYVAHVQGDAKNVLALVTQLADTMINGMKLPPIDTKVSESRAEANKKVPFETVMLYSRGLAEEDKGNKGKAVEYYKASLAKFPTYEPSQKRLATLAPQSAG